MTRREAIAELEAKTETLRKMPEQKPGRSKQDYGTPDEFIAAAERRFGKLTIDLAASSENTKAPRFIDEEEDSLADSCDWAVEIGKRAIGWLNPPFGHIEPWAGKCAAHVLPLERLKSKILFLTPASVGANWYVANVHEVARVYFLNGRLCFDGKDPYPKDCMLSVFGEEPGFEVWRWK